MRAWSSKSTNFPSTGVVELIFAAANQKSCQRQRRRFLIPPSLSLSRTPKWTHNFSPLSSPSPKHARRKSEREKWRNANYAEMSRIFHGKSTIHIQPERKREANINIPLSLSCLFFISAPSCLPSFLPSFPSSPLLFSRVAFDSGKLHENVSPSISLVGLACQRQE